jgi:glycosyltransferase involved in cell wall biosynthesis
VAPETRPLIVLSANTSWYLFNFRINLIRSLAPDWRIGIAAPRDAYTERLEALGCQHIRIDYTPGGARPLHDLRALLTCVREYRRIRPDIVLNFTPKANIFSSLAAIASGAKIVNNVSGLGRAFTGAGRPWVRRISTWLYQVVGRHARHTFYQNRRDYRFGLDHSFSGAEQSSLIPGSGADLTRFKPCVRPKEEPILFLHCARLMREKGTLDFLASAEAVRARVGAANVGFIVAGPDTELSGQDRAEFHRRLDAAGAKYLGMVDDIEAHMAKVHAVVLPSIYAEGVPRSLIEAAASGKVLICYPNPGCAEIVRHDVNGLVATEPDPAALAEAMLEVIEMPPVRYLQMAESSVELARGEFDEQIVIAAYHRCIGRIHAESVE